MGVSGRIWTVVYFFAKMVVLRGRCLIFGPPEPTSRGSPGAPPGVHGFSPGGFRPYSILAAKGCQDVPEMMISRKLSVLFDARCALCIIDATFQAPRLDRVKRHKWFSKRYASGSLFTGRCSQMLNSFALLLRLCSGLRCCSAKFTVFVCATLCGFAVSFSASSFPTCLNL